jgi:hypothetical protein
MGFAEGNRGDTFTGYYKNAVKLPKVIYHHMHIVNPLTQQSELLQNLVRNLPNELQDYIIREYVYLHRYDQKSLAKILFRDWAWLRQHVLTPTQLWADLHKLWVEAKNDTLR